MSGSTTFDIEFTYQGVTTANGEFSFSTALLGQTITASELTSFTITFDQGVQQEASGTYSPLAVGSASEGSSTPYPYFDFNSATDALVPYQSTNLVLQGGTTAVPAGDPAIEFNFYQDQPAYAGILVGHLLEHGSFFNYGSFDKITITQEAACFVAGTHLSTQCGDVAVDELAVGDMIATVDGAFEPVRWLGRRSYSGRFLAGNPALQPILFRAGSLGLGRPRRDLMVSPTHGMLVYGRLIPARALVNGSTIVQQRGLPQVAYFHVELDRHSIILAEGAPSESFLEDGNRGQFHNAAEHAALYPDLPTHAERCAPWLDSGAELEAIRARLAVEVCLAA